MTKKFFTDGNLLFYTIITVLSLFLICIFLYNSKGSCFLGDDSWFSLYVGEEGIFDILISNGHGAKYFGQFLDKFLSMGLPCILGIHPENFMSTWHALFRGIFSVITLLCINQFAVIYEKSKFFHLLFYCFLILTFINYTIDSNIIDIYYAFYRYCFSLLFFGIFWLFLYKNFTGLEENTSKLKLILVSLCGYVVGTSSEIVFFISCTLISMIIIWDSIISRITKKVQSNNLINSLKIKLNKNFYIPVLFFATGVILFVTSSGFKDVSAERGMSSINITYDLFREFSLMFFQKCILDIKEFLIVFALLFFTGLYFGIKNKRLKPILFITVYLISVYTVMYSLILCGKTCYGGTLFLDHNNIIFTYQMLLIFPFAIILGFIYSNIKKSPKTLCIFYTIIIILFGFININFLSHTDRKIEKLTNHANALYFRKQHNFIRDKIIRFYYLNNKTVILPPEYIGEDTHYADDDVFDKTTNCVYEKNHFTYLYKRLYKTIPDVSPYLCVKDNAIDEFYANGGYITKEEVKKLDFNRLFDENYVLKKKENETNEIYTPEEINEIIKKIVL